MPNLRSDRLKSDREVATTERLLAAANPTLWTKTQALHAAADAADLAKELGQLIESDDLRAAQTKIVSVQRALSQVGGYIADQTA